MKKFLKREWNKNFQESTKKIRKSKKCNILNIFLPTQIEKNLLHCSLVRFKLVLAGEIILQIDTNNYTIDNSKKISFWPSEHKKHKKLFISLLRNGY